MFREVFADLHIHIGAGSKGEPVKITASRRLNFENILKESLYNKGLDMIGIIDCASPVVLADIETLLEKGKMEELADGGIAYGELVIIPGVELESREDKGGQAHYLGYFPYLRNLREFSQVMKDYITNINLSSQSTGLTGKEIFQLVEAHRGIFIPAHVFTPFKSFYGRCFDSYREIFTAEEWARIPAIELGLSSDTYMADFIPELAEKTFISNSDAHSLEKIAREYNLLRVKELSFRELELALWRKEGRRVLKNYGLDPALGKYHRSYCENCNKRFPLEYPVLKCPDCGRDDIVIGVKDRIMQISPVPESSSPDHRGEYIHQIPLRDIPGIGKKTFQRLLEAFGTEMAVIHRASEEELAEVLNYKIAERIIKARTGNLKIEDGGGGHYGKVVG
ncbi:MAG: TIGR00375 family protein [Halanaerobiaceae bacterium]|nr:TIGR00375 family protein [Halanaerobiaceae bacterium]